MQAADARLVGIFLTAGFFLFLTGAIRWRLDYQQELSRSLPVIGSSLQRWRWIHTWMIAGVILTLLGVAGLTQLFLEAGGGIFSSFGLVLLLVGSVPWLTGVMWRLTLMADAAVLAARSEAISPDTRAWASWFGHLHTLHLLTAYLAWIMLGLAVVETGLAAEWTGWLGIAVGVLCAAGYLALKGGPFAPPILVHTYTLVLGVALLITWA